MTWEPQSEPEFSFESLAERFPVLRSLSRLRPDEGWTAVVLVTVLCMITAWSIADARWIRGEDQLSSFLVWAAALAALWGWFSSRLPVKRWLAHFLGALVAAFVLSVMAGYAVDPSAASPKDAFDATAAAVAGAYMDLVWYRYATTYQVGHFALFLGVLVWATAQAASYDVFGHHRPVNAVLLLAVVLVANMSLTLHDQFPALVVFSVFGLALLLQSHAADERSAWFRHRIWRPREMQTPHLRGGMAFASIAVIASLMLTSMASSAPLASAWPTVADNFRDVATWVSRYLPNSGQTRIPVSGDFTSTQVIAGSWTPDNSTVFTVRTSSLTTAYHWRMITYDLFNKTGWDQSSPQKKVSVGADVGIESGSQDAAPPAGRTEQKLQVNVVDKTVHQLVVPNEPVSASVPTDVTQTTANGVHVAFATTNADSYVVTALVPALDASGSGITENKLRIAGTQYPAGLREHFTQGSEFVGQQAQQLLRDIVATAPAGRPYSNPYDIAKAIQSYLKDPNNFTYTTDINSQMASQCQNLSTPDCFAVIRQGFCQQYATTMVMLLRFEGIPARYVQGFLPGTLDPHSGVYTVTRKDSHAWVEVYFPGYGWIEFDPTGGNQGQPLTIPTGPVVSPSPSASTTPIPNETDLNPRRTPQTNPGGATNTNNPGGDNTALIVAGSLLLGVVLAVFAIVWLRRRRPLDNPDVVYAAISRLAGRLGYKAEPTQTVYEYIGTLERVIPATRPQLAAVADAKVEVTYGRRMVGEERLRSLGAARQRIRMALLRLAIRRPPLPFRRRRKRR